MKIHWTDTAEGHLDAIYTYIAQNSEVYALSTVDRITSRTKQIGNFPLSGRRVSEFNMNQIREVYERPYRIIYHIMAERIDVIAIIHDARDVLRHDPNI